MANRLEGAVALVTGASSGIGEATAKSLAAQGAKVALVARRADRIERLAQEIAANGHTALAIEADVTDQEQAIAAVERTAGDFGRLDIVVNNAGVMLLGPIHGAPTEEWDRMIDVNLKGLLYVTHAALPHLFAATADSPRKVADVVNISSVAGRVVNAGAGVYNLTKHGVVAVSEALRQEASRGGVRVTIIEPGFVETELQGHNRPEVQEALKERVSKIEPLQSHDIADAIEYAVTRPAHVSMNELLIRPTTQP
ncbi:MAG: SDR family NAD(P)-dependent oxidoreductase [Solirubrobacterales bacterium]|nr:SDR family NAD(P)-dependent oxidoreductase [Solirubrobacterales bacterium]HRV60308.1 SDR family NAD(P)-dependent oxidoreductase [Solirubrobacterales bacterium]